VNGWLIGFIAFSFGFGVGVEVMIWAHDNKLLRYREGCREHPSDER
jgi:hypothetical protein